MADKTLEIILAAKDMTGTALTNFEGRLKSITSTVFSLQGALGMVAGG